MPGAGIAAPKPGLTPVRGLTDDYVGSLARLDPMMATQLGMPGAQDREDLLPDMSPAGQQALDDLARSTVAELDALDQRGGIAGADERRCARLLRERLTSGLARSDAGEHLRIVSNIFGPVHEIRETFLLMPAGTVADWAVVARRMAGVGNAVAGYRESLAAGAARGLFAAPRQVATFVDQLDEWAAVAGGRGWFADFVADAQVPAALAADLDGAAAAASAAVAQLRDWLASEYLPRAAGTPDGVGPDRYRVAARFWTGADLDLAETYAWGWSEYQSIQAQMRDEAHRVLPGAAPRQAMQHLDEHGEAVDGVEEFRLQIQSMLDAAITRLDGTHFELPDQLKVIKACIAPAGSGAAPFYAAPSQDFSRPGQTFVPTMGRTRFSLWRYASTLYHEGVPGHHLQLGQWVHLSQQLSTYQTSVGKVSSCTEGWALYAEHLMDELGYLSGPGFRLGYLDSQTMRAIRVVIDIGMHLRLPIPGDSPVGAGERWTPALATAFFAMHSARGSAFVDSEIVRYLSMPGQAISYKLGERAWLTGRRNAAAARGADFDLRRWHMAALSLGSLGLDDLTDELASL